LSPSNEKSPRTNQEQNLDGWIRNVFHWIAPREKMKKKRRKNPGRIQMPPVGFEPTLPRKTL
jgi:hypothetical protein